MPVCKHTNNIEICLAISRAEGLRKLRILDEDGIVEGQQLDWMVN